MNLELTEDEARFLTRHLARHIEEVDAELSHTEKHSLQHELALELDQLKGIQVRLRRLAEH